MRSKFRGQYVLPAFVRWQIGTLLDAGYQPASLSDLASKPSEAAERFAVTFDDAYRSIADQACSYLAEQKIPATIFAVAGQIGGTNLWDQQIGDRREELLSASELRDLDAAGFEIGSHTLSHPHLTTLRLAKIEAEVRDSKRALEDLLGKPVRGFCYPYGDFDGRVRAMVVEAGYHYATSTTLAALGAATDPFAIPRVNIRWNTVGARLLRKIARACRAGEH